MSESGTGHVPVSSTKFSTPVSQTVAAGELCSRSTRVLHSPTRIFQIFTIHPMIMHSQALGMCQVGRVPTWCILKIGIQRCSESLLGVGCVRAILTLHHHIFCQRLSTISRSCVISSKQIFPRDHPIRILMSALRSAASLQTCSRCGRRQCFRVSQRASCNNPAPDNRTLSPKYTAFHGTALRATDLMNMSVKLSDEVLNLP